ncbi:hypothetical protein [uncultured Pontibacter sp.]|uniref:hypothetical protein n=1 Tax=uncultured Pontibacter sp. TaxID=453356 RepID=UPI00261D0EC3|nr:hypothetical protein [uncultured Pontibacter sp.]
MASGRVRKPTEQYSTLTAKKTLSQADNAGKGFLLELFKTEEPLFAFAGAALLFQVSITL